MPDGKSTADGLAASASNLFSVRLLPRRSLRHHVTGKAHAAGKCIDEHREDGRRESARLVMFQEVAALAASCVSNLGFPPRQGDATTRGFRFEFNCLVQFPTDCNAPWSISEAVLNADVVALSPADRQRNPTRLKAGTRRLLARTDITLSVYALSHRQIGRSRSWY